MNEREKIIRLWFDMWLYQKDMGIDDIFAEDSFPWLIVLIYLAILLIVQFTLISYTTGNLKKQSLVEQIRTME